MPIIPPSGGGTAEEGANKSLSNLIETAIQQDLTFAKHNAMMIFANGSKLQAFGTGIVFQSEDTLSYITMLNGTLRISTPNGISFNSRKITAIAAPTADTDGANKKYIDDEIAKIPAPVEPVEGANLSLSNLEAVAANQNFTFDKVNPRVLFGDNQDGGIDFSKYAIEEDENKLSIYEIDNAETGIQINPSSIVLETVDGVDIVDKKLLRVATPTADTDAANKKYVDDKNPITNTSITLGDNVRVELSSNEVRIFYADIGLKTLKDNVNETTYNSCVPINIHSFSVGKMYTLPLDNGCNIVMNLYKETHDSNSDSELLYSLVLNEFVRSHTFVLPEPLLIDNSADFDYYWRISLQNLNPDPTTISLMSSVEYSAAPNPVPEA